MSQQLCRIIAACFNTFASQRDSLKAAVVMPANTAELLSLELARMALLLLLGFPFMT